MCFDFGDTWKIYVTEFSCQTHHRWRYMDICDFANDSASFSSIPAGQGDKSCHEKCSWQDLYPWPAGMDEKHALIKDVAYSSEVIIN